jgi:hypothetical protein
VSRTELTLKEFKIDGLKQTATFEGLHSTGGPRGTILTFDVDLERSGGGPGWEARLRFDTCDGDSPKAALRRLANWCDRAAQALDQDDEWWEGTSLPLGRHYF